MNFLKIIFSVAFTVSIFGCTKETITERSITPARQATPQMSDSVTIDNLNQVKIAKNSLGKAFILIPSMTTSGRQPLVNFLKPLIVSFEKAGDQVALFNLTDEQLYKSVPSSRLLQTFSIVAEDESSILLNLSKGFTSFDANDTLSILIKDSFTELKKSMQSGVQSSYEVKESFVRSVKSENNSVYIKQVARIRSESMKEKTEPFEPNAKAKTQFVAEEATMTFTFELKPYIATPAFEIRTHDKEQRVGYFLNFAVKEQQDDPIPQIARWDANPTRGPIAVRLSANTPAEAVQAIEEGILYWNRVAGQDFLKMGPSFAADEKQTDRTVFVYWIPWDTAGFARAGLQADPITGEIFRGQVIMTSSWYKMPREGFSMILAPTPAPQPIGYAACTMDQNKFLNLSVTDLLEDSALEKATLDTVRTVMAHEMGHVLGLRHNFAGSSVRTSTDAQLMTAKLNYLAGKHTELLASSTTVMDYTNSIETAMNGAVILNTVLPYDKLAIDWGTFGKGFAGENNQYCSDEHILLATSAQKSIYGCERFDGAKNLILGAVDSLVENEKRKVISEFKNALKIVTQPKSHYALDKTLDSWLSSLVFSVMSDQYTLDNFVYKNPAATYLTIGTVVSALLPSLTGSTLTTYDPIILTQITKDAAEVGGLAGILEKIVMPLTDAGGKFYENQVEALFQKLDPEVYKNKLSPEQFEKIKITMLEKARLADGKYVMTVINAFPITKPTYAMDPVTKEFKMTEGTVATQLLSGKNEYLIKLYSAEYERSIRQKKIKGIVNGSEKEYGFSTPYNSDLDTLRKLFSAGSAVALNLTLKPEFSAAKETLKNLSVANTVDLLKTMGLMVGEPIASADLSSSLNKVDWTKVSGVSKVDLDYEVAEYKKWEEIK